MSERKPPGMRLETWVDQQIREAQERGDFDNLPGFGKPLKGLDRPFTAERWAIDWVQREGGDVAAMLPPLLQLRRERARLLAALPEFSSEPVLRATIEDFNLRLLAQYRRPIDGPMVAVGVLDVEETLTAWRALRPPPTPPPAEPPPRPRPRRWWRRTG